MAAIVFVCLRMKNSMVYITDLDTFDRLCRIRDLYPLDNDAYKQIQWHVHIHLVLPKINRFFGEKNIQKEIKWIVDWNIRTQFNKNVIGKIQFDWFSFQNKHISQNWSFSCYLELVHLLQSHISHYRSQEFRFLISLSLSLSILSKNLPNFNWHWLR